MSNVEKAADAGAVAQRTEEPHVHTCVLANLPHHGCICACGATSPDNVEWIVAARIPADGKVAPLTATEVVERAAEQGSEFNEKIDATMREGSAALLLDVNEAMKREVLGEPRETIDVLAVLRGESKLDSEMEQRISAVQDSGYEAGEWMPDNSDEKYEAVHDRCVEAVVELRKHITRTVLEYGRVGDQMLAEITTPENDSEVLTALAKYIEGVCESNKDDAAFAVTRAAKLAQADRLHEYATQLRTTRICWRCKKMPGVVFDGTTTECISCASETGKRTRAMLAEIDEAVREGLPAWPRIANRVEFVRECIKLHREDAARPYGGNL